MKAFRFSSSKNEIVICQKKNLSNTTIEAIILWIGATVSLMLQCVSWENCHSSLQWVGWLNSETLRIIIEQSNWVAVRRHCNTFWQFMIILQVFKKTFLKALFIQNNILIRCHALVLSLPILWPGRRAGLGLCLLTCFGLKFRGN